ncbi:MAG: flavodoxin family protein [Promethearchaeota archaeon]|nr:MAG: flavodoxin family protein [Candidatus Lokiarchaeota archaeon]
MKNKLEHSIKVVSVISSPHKNGFSATLTRNASEAAQKEGAEIEELYLPDFDLKYCKGCMNCLTGDKCALDDDLNMLRGKLEAVDGIIISSPTYAITPNAIMMNFLQRVGIYSVYRSSLSDKYIVGISTAGAIGANKVAKTLTEITDGLFEVGYRTGYLGVKIGEGNIDKSDLTKAQKLGKKLVQDIRIQKHYRFQKLPIKLLSIIAIKPKMRKNLIENKKTSMRGVFKYLRKNGKI